MNELEKFEELLRIGQESGLPIGDRNANMMMELAARWSMVCIDAHMEVKEILSRAVPVFDPILLGC